MNLNFSDFRTRFRSNENSHVINDLSDDHKSHLSIAKQTLSIAGFIYDRVYRSFIATVINFEFSSDQQTPPDRAGRGRTCAVFRELFQRPNRNLRSSETRNRRNESPTCLREKKKLGKLMCSLRGTFWLDRFRIMSRVGAMHPYRANAEIFP